MTSYPGFSKNQVRLAYPMQNNHFDNGSEKMTQQSRISDNLTKLKNAHLVSDRKAFFEAMSSRYGAKDEHTGKANKTKDIDRKVVPFTSRPRLVKLEDEHVLNELRDSGIQENFDEYFDNDLVNDATYKREHSHKNGFSYLDGMPISDTQLSITPVPSDTPSGFHENIYDSVEYDYVQYEKGGAYWDENQSSLEIAARNTPLSTPKLQLVIQELIDTERAYIKTLKFVIEQYLNYYLNHPEKSRELPGMPAIFGNIEYLYEGSKYILEDFITCNSSVDCIANIFLQSKQLFTLYAEYLRNKARTRAILEKIYQKHLEQREAEISDSASWDSYLIKPLQRLVTYKLLLERLQKELKKLGKENKNLQAAIDFVGQNGHVINSLLAIDSIKNCPIDLVKFGGLYLLKNDFNIKRKYKSVVFLFEGIIVFTTKHRLQKETYEYKGSINVNILALKTCSESSFIVSNHSECKLPDGDGPFSFELENSSEGVCETWENEIRKILKNQFYQFKHVLKQK